MFNIENRDLDAIVQGVGLDINKFSGRTILLTGSNGFLGRYFVGFFKYLNDKELLKKKCSLICIDNGIVTANEYKEIDDFKYIKHDISEKIDIEEDVDYVIHAASLASPKFYKKYPLQTILVNVWGTYNTLMLSKEKSVRGYLYFSSSECYGNLPPECIPLKESEIGRVASTSDRSCYDQSKLLGETLTYTMFKQFGLNGKICRPFNMFGPGQKEEDGRVIPKLIGKALRGEPLTIYGTGGQTREFTWISDGMVGFIKVLLNGRPAEIYNVGKDGNQTSMLELANTINKFFDNKLEIKLTPYEIDYPSDEPLFRSPSLDKSRSELNFNPLIKLETGLKYFIEYAKQNYSY